MSQGLHKSYDTLTHAILRSHGMLRRSFTSAAVGSIFGLFLTTGALAQSPAWPSQPVKWIAPFPTGGTVDQISRLLQPHMQQALGQPVVIDNRAGA